eukprot:TRINITY_DN12618_c0_g1_i1.p2 TRINITY_DN12618_c0_g1~~TRINITY_DN12618_c0_g1_i1.p2  ORF type:complete len:126 (-),score=51.17 TRINITY_DN12618_c0_g1_i1:95-472(-)
MSFFFFQAEDGIRDLVRSRGLGDVYKRQQLLLAMPRKRKGDEGEAAPAEAPAAKQKKKPKTTTIKDKILGILASHDGLIGAPSIKKLLVREYGMAETGAFNTNVNKTLKNMCEQQDALSLSLIHI